MTEDRKEPSATKWSPWPYVVALILSVSAAAYDVLSGEPQRAWIPLVTVAVVVFVFAADRKRGDR